MGELARYALRHGAVHRVVLLFTSLLVDLESGRTTVACQGVRSGRTIQVDVRMINIE